MIFYVHNSVFAPAINSLTKARHLSHPFTARLILAGFLVAGGSSALADVPPMFRPNAGSLLNQATPPTVVPTLPSSTLPALPDEDLGKPGPDGAKGQGLAFRSRGRQPVAAGAVAGAAVRSDRPGTRSCGFAQGGGAHYPDLPRTGIFSCPCLPSDAGYCRWRRAHRGARRPVWRRRNRRLAPAGAAARPGHPGRASGLPKVSRSSAHRSSAA